MKAALVVAALVMASSHTIIAWPAATVAARAGRYYGLKQVGRDPYTYESLGLVIDDKGGVTGEKVGVADVKVTPDRIALRLVGARPSSLPERLSGRFVRRGPPANAKGPVDEGILLDGTDWFLAREKP